MEGLIGTGEAYKDEAISGFARESAEDQKIKEANEQIQQGNTQGIISGASSIASLGIMLAAMW
jgi:hypothetical protein